MRPKIFKNSNSKFSESARCAFTGVKTCFVSERNFKIHIFSILIVIILSVLLKINYKEWIILIILFGLAVTSEMINSSIESVVDLVTDDFDILAKRAKDIAAGAVLIIILTSVIIGLIIFIPKIINLIY